MTMNQKSNQSRTIIIITVILACIFFLMGLINARIDVVKTEIDTLRDRIDTLESNSTSVDS